MFKTTLTAITFLLITTAASAQHTAQLNELIAAENAFAQMALDSGAKKAFVQNFDPQSITFNGDKPVSGLQYWSKAPDKEPVILWYPAMSAISVDGNLGYNIGPSLVKMKAEDEKPVYSGYFFSVWKRDATGKFKVMLDGGASKPMEADHTPEPKLTDASALSDKPVSKAYTEKIDIEQLDAAFNGNLVLNINGPYKLYLANDSWLIRTGSYASTGKADNLAHLKTCKINKYLLTYLGGGVAASNDLAYAYGKAELNIETEPGSAKHVTGFYYRTWQRFGNKWKIVADLVSY